MTSDYRRRLADPRLAVPLAVAAILAGFVIIWVVGGSSSGGHQGAAAAPRPTVVLHRTHLGRVVAAANGHSLYLFREDKGPHSSCYEGCAKVWPALLVASRPRAGPGIDARKLTTARRRGTRLRQVVYAGHPLYTMVADERPGQTEGQGWQGTWFLVSRSGHQIGKAPKSAGGY